MRIGLYNLEPKVVNSAMMRVSTYHKGLGDNVETYFPLAHSDYDKVYCFSIFKFTPKETVTMDMISGGTGFNITGKLPQEIEDSEYDWSIYPKCDFSIVWFSRGCPRKCSFCVVPEKEGGIEPIEPKNLNPNGKYIVVNDNNFFASPKWREAIKQLQDWGQPVAFDGGIDARTLDKEMCLALSSLRHKKQMKIAWDIPKQRMEVHLDRITKYIKPYKIMCFVLIGFWSTPEEDLHRVETLRSYGIDPYAMPYNKKDKYQQRFARWVNHKAIFKSVKWEDYRR